MIVTLVILACFSPTPWCMHLFKQTHALIYFLMQPVKQAFFSWQAPVLENWLASDSPKLQRWHATQGMEGHGKLNQNKSKKA